MVWFNRLQETNGKREDNGWIRHISVSLKWCGREDRSPVDLQALSPFIYFNNSAMSKYYSHVYFKATRIAGALKKK
jgi:hypothetical protein